MPDFRKYVRQHLPPLGIGGGREPEIIEELALELEERFERLLHNGADPQDVWADLTSHIEWHNLASDLRSAFDDRDSTTTVPVEPERNSRMLNLFHEVRYGLRLLAKSPAFTITAILTIALGIGPNTAIFSVLNGVFWSPMGMPNGARASVLWSRHGDDKGLGARGAFHVSPRVYFEWQKQSSAFEAFGAVRQYNVTLNDDADYPQRIQVQPHTPGLISKVYGNRMTLGRDFLPEEGIPGNDHVVVISNKFWRERYKADPRILGKQLRLDKIPYTIVGVLEPGWWDHRREPLWPVLAISAAPVDLDPHNLTVIGLRKPGVTNQQAQADMNAIAGRLAQEYPATNAGWTTSVEPFRNNWLNDRARTNLWLLMGTVALVLLIACVNVANLLLARAASREKEIAVRASLGATSWQIFRQLITESLLLSVIGGTLGVALSWALLKVFWIMLPPFAIPPQLEIGLGTGVLLFTLGTTLAAGLIFGCAPAWRVSRQSANDALRQGGRSGMSRQRYRMGQLLVVAEFGLALTLLAAAGVVLRTYWSRTHFDFGVRTENILTFELPSRLGRLQNQQLVNERNRVLMEKLQATPGVLSAAAVMGLPLSDTARVPGTVAARPPADPAHPPEFRLRIVSPGFFDIFGVTAIRGRIFGRRDQIGTLPVAMVNEAFVKEHLPGLDPLGQELLAFRTLRFRIIGVYRDIANSETFGGIPRPEFLLPSTQIPAPDYSIVVRTALDPAQVRKNIAAAIRTLDAEQPMANVRTMEQVVDEHTAYDRFEAVLYASFAGLALLLAAVGIYGVMAFIVTQRTPEMGLRMALGASRGSVLSLILKDGLKLATAGLLVGGAGAWYASRLLRSSLYGTGAVDPAAFAAVALVLAGTAIVACILPARRAAAVDPMNSLRSE